MAYLLGSMGLSANVVVQWILEVAHFCLGVPMLLVGCKQDLRHCPRVIDQLKRTNQRPVTLEEVRHDRRSSWETVLTKVRVGFGSVSGDRGRVLFRMLCSNWRGCSGGVQLRGSCCSPSPRNKQDWEVPRSVTRALEEFSTDLQVFMVCFIYKSLPLFALNELRHLDPKITVRAEPFLKYFP